jgi:undecaprenyl-diphosphatase
VGGEPVTGGALSVWHACLLGVVQGLTEFLPVSSDGHLAVLQYWILPPMPAEERLAIDVALHLGTLVALIVYFRRELLAIAAALGGRGPRHLRSWVGLLALGTLPAALVGVTFKQRIAATQDSLPLIGLCFLTNGSLLFLANAVQGAERSEESLGFWDALVVGFFQASALLPGVSRSGTTIASGMLMRMRSDVAVKFSFLLGVPAIAGAVMLEGFTVFGLGRATLAPLAVGVVVAGVTGLAAIAVLLRAVRGGRLSYFAYYCWTLGFVVLAGAAWVGRP